MCVGCHCLAHCNGEHVLYSQGYTKEFCYTNHACADCDRGQSNKLSAIIYVSILVFQADKDSIIVDSSILIPAYELPKARINECIMNYSYVAGNFYPNL